MNININGKLVFISSDIKPIDMNLRQNLNSILNPIDSVVTRSNQLYQDSLKFCFFLKILIEVMLRIILSSQMKS